MEEKNVKNDKMKIKIVMSAIILALSITSGLQIAGVRAAGGLSEASDEGLAPSEVKAIDANTIEFKLGEKPKRQTVTPALKPGRWTEVTVWGEKRRYYAMVRYGDDNSEPIVVTAPPTIINSKEYSVIIGDDTVRKTLRKPLTRKPTTHVFWHNNRKYKVSGLTYGMPLAPKTIDNPFVLDARRYRVTIEGADEGIIKTLNADLKPGVNTSTEFWLGEQKYLVTNLVYKPKIEPITAISPRTTSETSFTFKMTENGPDIPKNLASGERFIPGKPTIINFWHDGKHFKIENLIFNAEGALPVIKLPSAPQN